VDTASLTPASKLLTIVLMFIGGSPGSTAGGVKTTTVAVMIIYIFSNLRNDSGCNVFHRRVGDEVIKKAAMVFGLNLFLGLVSTLILLATSNLAMDDVLFEVFSAISTVGMTTGITRDLNTVGRIVIILLMYCGRVGSMTFALSLIQKPSQQLTRYPVERITIG
jgi:trk system potassium uptake protein TrkH